MDEKQTPEAKTKFQIDLFQTARVHTERFVQEFDTKEEAEAFAREQAKSKGIDPDFEVEALPEPETDTPVLDNAAEVAKEDEE